MEHIFLLIFSFFYLAMAVSFSLEMAFNQTYNNAFDWIKHIVGFFYNIIVFPVNLGFGFGKKLYDNLCKSEKVKHLLND